MSLARIRKWIIAAQAVVAGALTFGALLVARDYGGRLAFWLLGLAFLFLAGIALFRLLKKV